MKIYVLYVSGDYDHAVYMSLDKKLCKKEMETIKKRGVKSSMWIGEYDFSIARSFELECS